MNGGLDGSQPATDSHNNDREPACNEFGRALRMVVTSSGEWGPAGERIEVTYTYYLNNLVQYATYSNGTRTYYEYDNAERMTRMRHELADGSDYFKDVSYTYYANGWLATIFEQYGAARGGGRPDPEPEAIEPLEAGGHWYGTKFIYDNRGRLIRETREGEVGMGSIIFLYDLEYSYDQVGNRTEKADHLTEAVTTYIYDVEDREEYGSCSNRLMTYQIDDPSTGDLETVWYYYDYDGNVKRIVRYIDGDARYRSTWFVYNTGGQVEYVVGEEWEAIEELGWKYNDALHLEYAVTTTEMTWDDARAYAQSRGGDLASIGLQVESWIWEYFRPDSGTVSYWVGAQQDPDGTEPGEGWEWFNASPPEIYLWLDDEPDDGGEGDCPPTCLNYDVAEYVVDADHYDFDDGLDANDGSALHLALIERPRDAACDPAQDQLRNFHRTFAWQFRYDSPRGRYMRRMLDPDTLVEVLTEWSDYDFEYAWSDFSIEGTEAVTTRDYLPTIAHADVDGSGDWTEQGVYHGNQIGSTELLTDETANVVREWAYTAFGEPADLGGSAESRYRYAGAWGYQSHDDFPFLHVGHRWYDPETGRFLQRDPRGIAGGLNVYEYVQNNPLLSVDPSGLGWWDKVKKTAKKAWDVIKRLPSYCLPSSPVPAAAAPDIANAWVRGAKRNHGLKDHEDGLPDSNCPTCNGLTPKSEKR